MGHIEIRLIGATAKVLVDGKEVAQGEADLKGLTTFAYGIGDHTGTFVELDEFRYVEGQ